MSSSTSESRPGKVIAGIALLIVAGVAWFATGGNGVNETPPAAGPEHAADPAMAPPVAAQSAVPAASSPADPTAKPSSTFTLSNGARPGKIRLPDGSVVDAINDVAQDIDMIWDEQPFSPIVDTVFHNGWWWWKHQDGAWSTVKMIDLNGVPQATPILAREGKGAPAPTADEAMDKLRQQQGTGTGR